MVSGRDVWPDREFLPEDDTMMQIPSPVRQVARSAAVAAGIVAYAMFAVAVMTVVLRIAGW
ncbi:MAG TPA: hypothetical protein VNZ58_13635 [Thermomicrobiales bacterium]|nr:hypothetical protein [Thermomicrobiales bacterium]